jgi:hypothetical protein
VRDRYDALRAEEASKDPPGEARRVLVVVTEKDYARSAATLRACLLRVRPLILRCRLHLESREDEARLQALVRTTLDAFRSPRE